MKIVIIEQDIDVMGGVERIISTLANNLCKDNEVYILSEHKNNAQPFFKYDSSIKINYIIDKSKNNRFDRKNNTFLNRLTDYIDSKIDKIITCFINSEMKRILKEADCIIFGRVHIAVKIIPYLQKNNIKCKILVRDAIHLESFDKKIKRKVKKYFPQNVNTFIVSSDESIEEYRKFFSNTPNNVSLRKIYNPLGIIPQGKYNYDSKTIVSLGRLDNQKGFDDLILAFNLIHKKFPDWKLKIYGKGPFEKKLVDLLKEHDLKESVEILPGTKNVVGVLNESSIFVMTSRYEGYANMLVEAMSCGMPVISYNWLMGANDIIDDGINGTIVKLKNRYSYFNSNDNHENIENLAAALEDLMLNEKKCEVYSQNAIKIIDSRNVNTIMKKWEEIILEKGDDLNVK